MVAMPNGRARLVELAILFAYLNAYYCRLFRLLFLRLLFASASGDGRGKVVGLPTACNASLVTVH